VDRVALLRLIARDRSRIANLERDVVGLGVRLEAETLELASRLAIRLGRFPGSVDSDGISEGRLFVELLLDGHVVSRSEEL
jgi:hypothetical protein